MGCRPENVPAGETEAAERPSAGGGGTERLSRPGGEVLLRRLPLTGAEKREKRREIVLAWRSAKG